MGDGWKNKLYFGDNLVILREHVASDSVDLVYLDPPFNSNASYNVLFGQHKGDEAGAQITAFEDTWHWGMESEAAFKELVERSTPRLVELMRALRAFLGQSDMMAYLTMMAIRLVELHRVLKPTGSLYLHCDPTASHYLKIVLDAVFGIREFQNEIVWQRTTVHSDSKTWSRVSDSLFFFTKSSKFTWHAPYSAHSDQYLEAKYRNRDEDGRLYMLDNMTSPNPRPNMMYEWRGHTSPPKGWRYSKETMARLDAEGRIWYPDDKSKRPRLKRYLEDMPGRLIGNVWTDISPINSRASERLGYPTQKPEALLERIIKASSNEGDLVLDPFCGCGTTVVASERLKRRWIGIDITHLAIALMVNRLKDSFGYDLLPFEVEGVPKDLASARELANQDRYHFEWWALSLVDARPAQDKRKGADTGVDGVIYFYDDESGSPKKAVVQVKSGKVQVSHVRDLIHVMEREKAAVALLVTLEDPTDPMKKEAATAGFYEPEHFQGRGVPRFQIFTIAELLDGRRPELPRFAPAATFKQAPRKSKEKEIQGKLW